MPAIREQTALSRAALLAALILALLGGCSGRMSEATWRAILADAAHGSPPSRLRPDNAGGRNLALPPSARGVKEVTISPG